VNLPVAHADGRRGREALAALEFYAHADIFMNPTAERADVVLPVASPFEREGLKIGFDISAEARARLNASLDPRVVAGQHGWWEACAELGAPGYDPFGPDGVSLSLIIGGAALDPISGTAPHRAYLCEIRPVGAAPSR